MRLPALILLLPVLAAPARTIDGGYGTVTAWGETEVTLHYVHG